MLRPISAILIALGLCAACGNGIKTKENVQAAILSRLQAHSGLNLSELDVSTTDVSFQKNLAFATVAIHPKGDPNVKHGMSMKYTLEERGGKWEVLNAGGPKLGGPAQAQPGGGALPPGHPAADSPPPVPDGSEPKGPAK